MANMVKIKNITAREIIDSRGHPTVEAEIVTANGFLGRASVPSGASTGTYEAVELRDNDERFGGMGVLKAVENIKETINSAVSDKEFGGQKEFDDLLISLDGTDNKRRLGANAILACSLAFLKASAKEKGLPAYSLVSELMEENEPEFKMPIPMVNILNGGKHAGNNLDVQEFMIVPKENISFKESIRLSAEIFHSLGKIIKELHPMTGVGDEGGYAPPLSYPEEALNFIVKACRESKYEPGKDVFLALDVAANELKTETGYNFRTKESVLKTSEEILNYYIRLKNQYPLVSIEDPFGEDDWDSTAELTRQIGEDLMIVGDDLFVTNKTRLEKGLEKGACNAILIKPNQIGTISETLEVIKKAKAGGFRIVVSHRSGETEDSVISDIAVGSRADYVKFGSTCRGERTAKYNRLIRIEEEINS